MPMCCVPKCLNTLKTKPLRSFHRFPVESRRRNIWIKCLQFKKECTPNLRVCSDHFMQKDLFISSKDMRRRTRLSKTAFPVYVLPNEEQNTHPAVNDSKSACSSLQAVIENEHNYCTNVPGLQRKYEEALISLRKYINKLKYIKMKYSRTLKENAELTRKLKKTLSVK